MCVSARVRTMRQNGEEDDDDSQGEDHEAEVGSGKTCLSVSRGGKTRTSREEESEAAR